VIDIDAIDTAIAITITIDHALDPTARMDPRRASGHA